MAHRYHINPATGRAGQCRAQSPETCQFSLDSGTVVQHYDREMIERNVWHNVKTPTRHDLEIEN